MSFVKLILPMFAKQELVLEPKLKLGSPIYVHSETLEAYKRLRFV